MKTKKGSPTGTREESAGPVTAKKEILWLEVKYGAPLIASFWLSLPWLYLPGHTGVAAALISWPVWATVLYWKMHRVKDIKFFTGFILVVGLLALMSMGLEFYILGDQVPTIIFTFFPVLFGLGITGGYLQCKGMIKGTENGFNRLHQHIHDSPDIYDGAGRAGKPLSMISFLENQRRH